MQQKQVDNIEQTGLPSLAERRTELRRQAANNFPYETRELISVNAAPGATVSCQPNIPIKHDDDKPRYDLIPPRALEELAKIYSFGAKKYADHNWLAGTGFTYGRIFAAIMRHLWAFWRGEDRDPETGFLHAGHAAFGCFALIEYIYRKKGIDDRP